MLALRRWLEKKLTSATRFLNRQKGDRRTSWRPVQLSLPSLEVLEGRMAPAIITTVAGNGIPGYSGNTGQATNATLNAPNGVAVDNKGDFFIADSANNVIREVTGSGVITTVAGNGIAGYSGNSGQATGAMLNKPTGVAVDGAGDLFIADSANNVIREVHAIGGGVTPASIITTVAGTGIAGYSGNSGLATNATLNKPTAVAVDKNGDLFIADSANNVIREVNAIGGVITPASTIITAAGTGTAGYSGNSGLATNAMLNKPTAVAVDSAGDLFISDSANNVIREVNAIGGVITPASTIITAAGTGTAGYSGNSGLATNATLNKPTGVAVDSTNDLFIADSANNVIREVNAIGGVITPASTIITAAGTGTAGYTGNTGQATNATLNKPTGVAVDSKGNLFIADTGNNVIREVGSAVPTIVVNPTSLNLGTTTQGMAGPVEAYVISGSGLTGPLTITSPTGVELSSNGGSGWQSSLALSPSGGTVAATTIDVRISAAASLGAFTGLLITDTSTGATQQNVSLSGSVVNVATIAVTPASLNLGTTTRGMAGPVQSYVISGSSLTGPIIITAPTGVELSANSGFPWQSSLTLFPSSGTVAPFTIDVRISAAASTGAFTGLLITDTSTGATQQNVSVSGSVSGAIITTVAGTGTAGYSGNTGQATNALLNKPTAVAVDNNGDFFIADSANNVIREVSATGIITTVAGTGTAGYSGNSGQATNATLNKPTAVVVDKNGNLFIADSANNVIREVNAIGGVITPASTIITVAGNGTAGYSGNSGQATNATLHKPIGVAVDNNGNLFIADSANNVIREVNAIGGVITTASTIITVAGTGTAGYSGNSGLATNATLNAPTGVAVDNNGNLFIADSANNVIREVNAIGGVITTASTIITVAGTGTAGYTGNSGQATNATLNAPTGVAVDNNGNLFIADSANNVIREVNAIGGVITPASTITTVAGTGIAGYSGNSGQATNATLNKPTGVAVDSKGDLFIADSVNNVIREVM